MWYQELLAILTGKQKPDENTAEGPACAKKAQTRGEKIRARLLPVFAIVLVMGITAVLLIYRNRVAELGNFGYLGAFLICLASNASFLLPVPGVLLLFALGATFNPILVGIVGAAGGTFGEMTGYFLGLSGRGILKNNRWYQRSETLMKRWGFLTVFAFAFVPFLPLDLAGMAAGVLRFPVWKFLLAVFSGKVIKYVAIAVAGYYGFHALLHFINQ
jgi:uncharacterized membrane protein YdjX (TVP38/TMEM64 family)